MSLNDKERRSSQFCQTEKVVYGLDVFQQWQR